MFIVHVIIRNYLLPVFGALDSSNKYQQHADHLSFKINSLPKCFDLNDPDVLNCLSLTYKVKWPLNILLTSDVVVRYDRVFKFLLKVNRVSWVMKKLFMVSIYTFIDERKRSFDLII